MSLPHNPTPLQLIDTVKDLENAISNSSAFVELSLTGIAREYSFTDPDTQESVTVHFLGFDINDADWAKLTDKASIKLSLSYTPQSGDNIEDGLIITHNFSSWSGAPTELDYLVLDSELNDSFLTSENKWFINGVVIYWDIGESVPAKVVQTAQGIVQNAISKLPSESVDVQVNGTSIVNNGIADLITYTAYDATTNPLATKSDLPTATSNVTSGSTDVLTSGGAYTALSNKQDKTDSSLQTAAQTVVEAINEVNSIAKQSNRAKGFASYSALITDLNSASATEYKVGQSFYVQTKNVPDLWVISVESSSVAYTYIDDATFVAATGAVGGQQVGYYKLAQLETQKVDLTNYVQKSTTIAGIDLQDNITVSEMQTALTDTDHNFVSTTEKSTWNAKQDALVSGTNIKTVNNQSLLGSGNIEISGGSTVSPASEIDLGVLRAWVEDNCLCLSASEYAAFTNVIKGDALLIRGSYSASASDGILTIE